CRKAKSKSYVTYADRRAVLHVDQLGKPGKPGLPPSGHGESHGLTSGPSVGRALTPTASKRAGDFDPFEALDLVADLDVVVLLHGNAAFHAAAHFVDEVLEAAQRFQLALEHHGVVAQHADRLAAFDVAFGDHAAGDRTELGAAEHVAHLGDADDLLADLHAEQAGRRLLHLVDHVVDDREIAHVEAGGIDHLACRGIGTHVEADHQRLRGRRQGGVGFGDAADTSRDHVD